ncbi:hypothetical protein [Paenibacillus sp. FSL K6-2859]|uniref:hypothetical protein n=1 Tax=Paenibacillus sp. FSL K6-2859 TaxID=2921482 RepID=UPI0030FC1C7A
MFWQNYEIRIEDFGGVTTTSLSWSSAKQMKQIVSQFIMFFLNKTYTPLEYHYYTGELFLKGNVPVTAVNARVIL